MRILFVLLSAVLAGGAIAGDLSGEQVYQSVCSTCHAEGKDGAPVFGARKTLAKLVREGLDDLFPAAIKGVRKMPPRGGKAELSDLEVARGVVYMANAGGGKFAEPDAEAAARWRAIADRKKRKQ